MLGTSSTFEKSPPSFSIINCNILSSIGISQVPYLCPANSFGLLIFNFLLVIIPEVLFSIIAAIAVIGAPFANLDDI